MANPIYQFKRATAARWTQQNPILADTEPGFESDTKKVKFGDGATAWNALPYWNANFKPTTDALNNSVTTNTNQIATNTAAIGNLNNAVNNNAAGIINLNSAVALRAPLASPAFTGTPTAPTPAVADSSTKLATTEFVKTISAGAIKLNPMPELPGAQMIEILSLTNFSGGLLVGNNDIYTVPAGKRLFLPSYGYTNPVGGTINFYLMLKNGNTYYRLRGNTPVGATTSGLFGLGALYNAGETVAVQTTVAGGGFNGVGILFDDTASFKRKELFNLDNTQRTIYTVPAGKKARVLNNTQPDTFSNPANVAISNDSGAGVTVKIYYVPVGQTLNAAAHIVSTTTPGSGLTLTPNVPPILPSGWSIVAESSTATATQLIWLMINEF